jgi:hypothetical protein
MKRTSLRDEKGVAAGDGARRGRHPIRLARRRGCAAARARCRRTPPPPLPPARRSRSRRSNRRPGALDFLERIAGQLDQHGVRAVALAECARGADAAAAARRLAAAAGRGAVRTAVTQPAAAPATLRAALDLFRLPPAAVLVLAAGPGAGAAGRFAAAAGCRSAALPLAPLEAAAVAGLQAAAVAGCGRARVVRVGFALAPARAAALTAAGALPLLPADGVTFLPLDLGRPLEEQPTFDVFLWKASDFLEAPRPGSGAPPPLRAAAAAALASLPAAAPGALVVDALPALERVMDRAALAAALEAGCAAARRAAVPVRAAAWVAVEAYGPAAAAAVAAAGLAPPLVAKPRVAAGPPEAHQLALVLHADALLEHDLTPAPAILQEYVDHGGRLWKVYVAGEAVFIARRASTPDLRGAAARRAARGAAGGAPAALRFDSRGPPPAPAWAAGAASAPASAAASPSKPGAGPRTAGGDFERGAGGLDDLGDPEGLSGGPVSRESLARLAAALRAALGLTLFGFDVVFDARAGEAVVVDANALPSFGGAPGAAPAVRAALRTAWLAHSKARAAAGAG